MLQESVEPFWGLPFPWLGLALVAVSIALLAARALFSGARKNKTPRPGFTCPCWTPPWPPSDKEGD